MSKSKPEPDCPTAEFHDERLDMAYWFPKLRDLDVPTPESQPLPIEPDDEGRPEWDTQLAAEIVENLGGEAFVRSGYKSAAMNVKQGSYIPDWTEEQVDRTLMELVSQHAMMQMPLGESVWLREWLDLNFCKYARENLVPEVRVFIRDGEVVCYHPRLEGFDNHPDHREEAVEYIESAWPKDLEHGFRTHEPLEVFAERVAEEFDGSWSVDFVCDRDGQWWCTDMALDALYDAEDRGGEGWSNISEHPDDCEHDWERQIPTEGGSE